MPNVFDGTNPITDILGDEPTEREVTMENQSTMTIVEPLTNTQIPAGQTVLVRVIGDIAHETLVNNIRQINALQGLEVIGVTSVVIDSEDESVFRMTVAGANEDSDGPFQRFTYNGLSGLAPLNIPIDGYIAEIQPPERLQYFTFSIKLPSLSANQILSLDIGNATPAEFLFGNIQDRNYVSLSFVESVLRIQNQLNPQLSQVIQLNNMIEGDVFTLTVRPEGVEYQYGSENQTVALDQGFFGASPLNLVLTSASSDLLTAVETVSVQVSPLGTR